MRRNLFVAAGTTMGPSRSGSSYRNGEGAVVLTAIEELKDTLLDKTNRIIEELKEVKEELAMKELKEVKEELAMMKARDKGAAASAQQTQVQNERVTSPVLFLGAGRPMGSSISGSSYRNDDNHYVDDNLIQKLQRTRNSVMQLLNKAEEKQFTEPDIKEWLSIKHTMHDADALLDKIDTEARFREKYKEDGSRDEGFVQWATSENNRIIEELEDMVKDAAANMGLKASRLLNGKGAAASAWQTRIPNDRVTSPVLGKSSIVYGREDEKARSLKKVLSSPEPAAPGNKPEVIAIVGMGGLGKTTLAQYVYNQADVERRFTRSWASVSDNFDLVRVTRDILESLTGRAAGVRGLAPLQQKLEEQLTGKRFLIVLDDTWDFSKQNWEKLMAPFST